jgi:hypothetical protein
LKSPRNQPQIATVKDPNALEAKKEFDWIDEKFVPIAQSKDPNLVHSTYSVDPVMPSPGKMKKPLKKKPTTSDTATSSSNPMATSEPLLNCYTADELQEIIEKAHLEGWQEGYTKGTDYEVKEGMKLGKRSLHKGQAQGVLLGKAEERKKWLAAGHGLGLRHMNISVALLSCKMLWYRLKLPP